jgi:hypothetical protein
LSSQFENFHKEISRPWDPCRSLSGKLTTQWNYVDTQIAYRRAIQWMNPLSIFDLLFSSLQRAAVILGYGTFLEHKRETELHENISPLQHKVVFVKLGDSKLMALLRFAKLGDLDSENLRIRDFAIARISFRLPVKGTEVVIKCTAVSMPNVFGLPYCLDTIFHVLNKNNDFFAQSAVDIGKPLVYTHASVIIKIPNQGAQRQVDSIDRLCGVVPTAPYVHHWLKLLLNQHAGKREIRDPTTCLDLINSAIEKVAPNVNWTDDQLACLRSARSFPDRLSMIQGFPGCGKTFTSVGLGQIYRNLGMHEKFYS